MTRQTPHPPMTDETTTETDSDAESTATALERVPKAASGMAAEWQPPEGGIDGPNYAAVPIPNPDERPREDWACEERRAELLEKIREVGHPDNLPKTQYEYADEFDVSQPTIHKDIQALRRFLRQTSGAQAIEDIEAIKHRAVMDALETGDADRALELQLKYADFLFEIGRYQKAPDRKQVQEVSVDASVDEGLTDEQREHFEEFSEKLQQAGSTADPEPVDVESDPVATEDEGGEGDDS